MMNKKSILATWVMCLSMTAIFSQKQTVMQTKTMTKDELAVLQTVETMTKAFNGKDIEVVMGSYQKDALVIFEPGMQVRNFKQLKEMFLAAFAINPKFEYPQGHEVFVNGENATHIAPWIMSGTAPDGTQIKQSGLSVANLRKQKDGKWLLTFDNPHSSYLMAN